MSVLKSKRNESKIEYTRALLDLYKYIEERCEYVSKRKAKFIVSPLMDEMNEIYDIVLTLFDRNLIPQNEAKSIVNQIARKVYNLQNRLFIFWNLLDSPEKQMVHCAGMIDVLIGKIYKYGGYDDMENKKFIRIIDKVAIKRCEFLSNMCKFHKYIYTKIVNSSTICQKTRGTLLLNLADEALCRLFEANFKTPTTKEEYEKRTKNLNIALDKLMKMNDPTVAVFSLMGYSDRVMNEWTQMLNKEIELIKGLIKSDKKRFGNLP